MNIAYVCMYSTLFLLPSGIYSFFLKNLRFILSLFLMYLFLVYYYLLWIFLFYAEVLLHFFCLVTGPFQEI